MLAVMLSRGDSREYAGIMLQIHAPDPCPTPLSISGIAPFPYALT